MKREESGQEHEAETEEGRKTKEERFARILSCIPISRGVGKEELSYFTFKDIREGYLISVPLRKCQVPAIVVRAERAIFSKAELKSLPFGLRKVDAIKARSFLSPSFVESAQEAARYFATTTGAMLSSFTPTALSSECGASAPKEMLAAERNGATQPRENSTKHIPLLLQSADEERIATYRGIIREEFARGGSVFVCLPEITEIERLSEALSRGIPEYTFIFHSGISGKKLAALWTKALSEKHPILIVGTGQFFSLPRADIRTIIVEKESSRAYKTITRPYADIRIFAEIFARKLRARLIFGDLFLRAETIARGKNGDFAEFSLLVFRTLTTAERTLVDMRAKDTREEKTFSLMSDALIGALKDSVAGGDQMYVLCARRGLFPITVCNDCGSLVLCRECSAPLTLHGNENFKKGARHLFLCHKCGTREESSDVCAMCRGWRFALLGAGVERITEEIVRLFPDAPVFRMDRDTITTHKRALALKEKFYQTPGAILVGTEMAIPYLDREIGGMAVASVDSLFTIPDFRMNERVFSLLLRMRSRARKHFVIQTRDPENRVLRYALDGNMMDFYREEIAERKVFGYPPFSTLIKITREGAGGAVRKDIETLAVKETFAAYEPRAYEASAHGARGHVRMNLLLKIPEGTWVDENLLRTLRALPPHYAIAVDPESLL
ncbi:MAG: primosomal protein N' [Patescibacteria group bacterium]